MHGRTRERRGEETVDEREGARYKEMEIRIWLKILESVEPLPFMVVRSGVCSPTKNSQNGTNTKLRF